MLNNLVFLKNFEPVKWHSNILQEHLDLHNYQSLDKQYHYVCFSLNVYYSDLLSFEDEISEQLETCIPYAYIKDTVQNENDLIIFVDNEYPYPAPMRNPTTGEASLNQNIHFLTFFKKTEEHIVFKLMHEKSKQYIFEFGVL